MPQFDFSHVFWSQLAWLVVFFSILYFGIVRLTLPKLGRVMTAREDRVTGDIGAAEAAKDEADRMAIAHAASVVASQDVARAKLNAARASATASIEAKLAISKAALDARSDAAQAVLDTARRDAVGKIESVAADAAADIVEKLTGHRPGDDAAIFAARAALA